VDFLKEPIERARVQRHVPPVAVPDILAPPVARHAPRTAGIHNGAAHGRRTHVDRSPVFKSHLSSVWRTKATQAKSEFPRRGFRTTNRRRYERMHHEAIGAMSIE